MTFRTLITAAVVAFVLRAFIAGPCEPCFLAAALFAAIIIRRVDGIRRGIGFLVLGVACIGLFVDAKERVREQQSIRSKAHYFDVIHQKEGSAMSVGADGSNHSVINRDQTNR
jgi:hypothetical protein